MDGWMDEWVGGWMDGLAPANRGQSESLRRINRWTSVCRLVSVIPSFAASLSLCQGSPPVITSLTTSTLASSPSSPLLQALTHPTNPPVLLLTILSRRSDNNVYVTHAHIYGFFAFVEFLIFTLLLGCLQATILNHSNCPPSIPDRPCSGSAVSTLRYQSCHVIV